MIEITFVSAVGEETTVQVEPGTNIMQAALNNDIDGVIGECGGSMMCATCHCIIDDAFASKTGEKIDGEEDMLESAATEIHANSRLACQVTITDNLNGLRVHLPESQI